MSLRSANPKSSEESRRKAPAPASTIKTPNTPRSGTRSLNGLPCRKRLQSPGTIRSPSREPAMAKRNRKSKTPIALAEQQISFLDVKKQLLSDHSSGNNSISDLTSIDPSKLERPSVQETSSRSAIDEEDDYDDVPLSSFGWPESFEDDVEDLAHRNSLDSLPIGKRSLLSDLAMNSDNWEDKKNRRSFIEALLDVEELESPVVQRRPNEESLPNIYEDEVDAFFSSTIDDALLAEQTSNSKPSTFLTFWPNFLTADYFKTHGPNDRFYKDKRNENNVTPYFDANYLILDQLGAGEYSNVWKVRKLETGSVFAVKKTKTPFGSYADRWQQIVEVDHLRAVQSSRHCVGLTDAWEQDGYLFIQMELCKSGSLQVFLALYANRIDEELIWNILYEVALGVRDIHQANIIHLDLKPSNVLIDSTGTLKVGDFGLSVRWPAESNEIKGEGDRRYMAPDLLREQFDKPADIFSLGLMALEMAAGIVLPDTGESWEMLRLGDFSDLDQELSKTSKELLETVTWILTPNPQTRPTIEEILDHKSLQKISSQRQSSEHGPLYDYVAELKALSEQPSRVNHENSFCTPDTKRSNLKFLR